MESKRGRLHWLQKISLSLMGMLVFTTFVASNIHTLLWQSSDWLVSTVLPSVVIQLTNNERSQYSAQPLQRNASLDEAAKRKAEHMAANEYFSHFSPNGVSPWYWFDKAGYVYAHAGENLAIHFTDSSEVVEAWMNSPIHKENIVNGLYSEIGVGTAKGKFEGYDTVYVVQLFGTPAVDNVTKPESFVESQTLIVDDQVQPISRDNVALTTEIEVVEEFLTEADKNDILVQKNTADAAVLAVAGGSLIDTDELVSQEEIENDEKVDPDKTKTNLSEVVIIESSMVATSTGLAVANITTQNTIHAGGTLSSIATQPNVLLQMVYTTLALVVVVLLALSVVGGARRFDYKQVAYGVFLLFGMGGLWFAHSLLTTGAVIV